MLSPYIVFDIISIWWTDNCDFVWEMLNCIYFEVNVFLCYIAVLLVYVSFIMTVLLVMQLFLRAGYYCCIHCHFSNLLLSYLYYCIYKVFQIKLTLWSHYYFHNTLLFPHWLTPCGCRGLMHSWRHCKFWCYVDCLCICFSYLLLPFDSCNLLRFSLAYIFLFLFTSVVCLKYRGFFSCQPVLVLLIVSLCMVAGV